MNCYHVDRFDYWPRIITIKINLLTVRRLSLYRFLIVDVIFKITAIFKTCYYWILIVDCRCCRLKILSTSGHIVAQSSVMEVESCAYLLVERGRRMSNESGPFLSRGKWLAFSTPDPNHRKQRGLNLSVSPVLMTKLQETHGL